VANSWTNSHSESDGGLGNAQTGRNYTITPFRRAFYTSITPVRRAFYTSSGGSRSDTQVTIPYRDPKHSDPKHSPCSLCRDEARAELPQLIVGIRHREEGTTRLAEPLPRVPAARYMAASTAIKKRDDAKLPQSRERLGIRDIITSFRGYSNPDPGKETSTEGGRPVVSHSTSWPICLSGVQGTDVGNQGPVD
jgi:hypothetical protein